MVREDFWKNPPQDTPDSSAVTSRQQEAMEGPSDLRGGTSGSPTLGQGPGTGAQDTLVEREQESLPGPVDSGQTLLGKIPWCW